MQLLFSAWGIAWPQNSPSSLGVFESLHNFLNQQIIVAKNSSTMIRGGWLYMVSNCNTRSKKILALSNIPLDEWACLPQACAYKLSNPDWWILYWMFLVFTYVRYMHNGCYAMSLVRLLLLFICIDLNWIDRVCLGGVVEGILRYTSPMGRTFMCEAFVVLVYVVALYNRTTVIFQLVYVLCYCKSFYIALMQIANYSRS